MKKTFLLLLCLLGTSLVWAQSDSVRQYQTKMFPRQGSFGVGIEGSPILDFIGNMFNGTNSQSSRNNWNTGSYQVYGRYFLTDNSAIRTAVRISAFQDVMTNHVPDQAARMKDPLSQAEVEDRRVEHEHEWAVALGYQQFRGQGRLKGFYGADLFYSLENKSTDYYYGNAMNEVNSAPLSTISWRTLGSAASAKRDLQDDPGAVNRIGLTGFAGAEYYFMPQACIGFEVGLLLSARFENRGKTKYETMSGTQHMEMEKEYRSKKIPNNTRGFEISTGVPMSYYGNFYFMFHF